MTGINDFACEGTLTISGISMNRLAWAVLADDRGSNGLLQAVTLVEVRGDDRILPGAVGVIPYQRRITSVRMDLRIIVIGEVNELGVANLDHTTGLIDNLQYLYTNVVAPTGLTDGTRPAVLTLPGQPAVTASIHVLGLDVQEYQLGPEAVWIGTLQTSIPSGRYV